MNVYSVPATANGWGSKVYSQNHMPHSANKDEMYKTKTVASTSQLRCRQPLLTFITSKMYLQRSSNCMRMRPTRGSRRATSSGNRGSSPNGNPLEASGTLSAANTERAGVSKLDQPAAGRGRDERIDMYLAAERAEELIVGVLRHLLSYRATCSGGTVDTSI